MMQSLVSWWRPRASALSTADVVAAPGAPAAAPRVRAELDRGKRQVEARVGRLRELSERETLACGRVLAQIVDTARTIISDTDGALAAAITRSDETTTRFIGEMQRDIEAQEAAVEKVLALADAMQEAVSAIDSLSQYSDLLSINARIEAARLGDMGAGFAVIAEQTRQLSGTIRGAAERVGTAIVSMREGLPPVRERATAMRERARAFIEVVGEEMKHGSRDSATGGAGSHRLEAVMRLSNEALSHLQFQDPLVQELNSIDRDFAALAGRVDRVLAGEALPEPQASVPRARAAPIEAGKVTLFQED
jgi:methyl-accepting chemotaxis protein